MLFCDKRHTNTNKDFIYDQQINALCLSPVAVTMNSGSHHNSGLLCLIIGSFPKTTFKEIKIQFLLFYLKH